MGNIYYVSTTGSDAKGTGSFENPWATIQKAADIMQAGDKCEIRGGIYRETVIPKDSGTRESSIIFTNYQDEQVIISGTEPVTGWTLDEGSIYKASMDWDMEDQNQVFVNGEMMMEARWPNNTGTLLQPIRASVESGTSETITDSNLYGEDDFWKGAALWCSGGSEWIAWVTTIKGYDAASKTLSFDVSSEYKGDGGFNHFYTPKKGNPYVLMGIKAALDTEKEWWFDREKGELYLWAPGSVDPSCTLVEAKKRVNVIELLGCSYIEFRGIQTFGGGIFMDENTSHCLLKNIKGMYMGHSYQRDISEIGSINIGGHHNEANSCEFAYSSGSVVRVSGSDNKVVNCYIHDGNYAARWKGTFSIEGRRHLISHNTVCDSGRDLVTIHGIAESRIEYNDLYNAGWLTADLAMTYGHNTDGQNTVISYNKVHDNKAPNCSFGIYFDHLSHNFIMHHNVIWNVNDDPIRINNPSYYNVVCNNTAYNTGKTTTFDHAHRNEMFGYRIMNNIFNQPINLPEHVIESNNIISENPSFVDPDNLDFRIREDSPAVNGGVEVPGITDGFTGSAPDAGAYPLGSEDFRAGHDFDNPPDVVFKPVDIYYMNHVKNAAFEYGTLEAWTKSGAGNAQTVPGNGWGHKPKENTGTSMFELRLGGGIDGVEQVIVGLKPNTTYLLTGWMKVSDAKESVRLGVRDFGGEEVSGWVSNIEWTRKEMEFTTGSDNTSAVIYYEKTSDGPGYAYCDNTAVVAKG